MERNEESDRIEELDKKILKFYSKNNQHHWAWHSKELKEMLFERRKHLDDSFVWTPEAVQRFVMINDKIQDCFDKLLVEQIQVHSNLTKRLADKDEKFLNDFNLDVRVVPFVVSLDEKGDEMENDGIFEVLFELVKPISLKFIGAGIESGEIYFDRSLNWNIATPAFRCKELENVYIGYHLHELSDHCYWAITDILCINEIWGEVVIEYQHFVENI
ncbi:MAG: hypothetical protein LBH61_03925 [Dysgonamonadaceae bacterium]|jgi:hypothetical protein|nr:hypothetical protein [Dysgonamonadaceae bacterium]